MTAATRKRAKDEARATVKRRVLRAIRADAYVGPWWKKRSADFRLVADRILDVLDKPSGESMEALAKRAGERMRGLSVDAAAHVSALSMGVIMAARPAPKGKGKA